MKCASFKIAHSKCTLWKQRGNTDYLMLNHRELICGLQRYSLLHSPLFSFPKDSHDSEHSALLRKQSPAQVLIYKDVLADDKVWLPVMHNPH